MKRMYSALARSLVLAVVIASVTMLSLGCNTVRGVGEDTESAGKGIQRAAD